MFIRRYKDKWRFGERYKDPLTDKWRTVTISAEKNTRNTRHEAQIILDKKIEKKLTEITGKLPQQANMTLGELFDTYWTEKEPSWRPSTKRTYKNSYTIFLNYFGTDAKLSKLTPVMLTNHIDGLIHEVIKKQHDKNYKGSCNIHTVSGLKIYYARASMMLNYAVRKQFIAKNPFENVHIKWPKDHHRSLIENKYLDDDELHTILDYFYKNRPILGYMFEWQYLTGMRFGETAAVLIKDVDVKDKIVHVIGTLDYQSSFNRKDFKKQMVPKTDSSFRSIALSERAIQIYKECAQSKKQSDFLFTDNDGYPLGVGSANDALRNARKHFKSIDKVLSTHTFRHTHVSKLAELGAPLYVIQHNVGHSNSAITRQVYLHVTKNAQEQLRNKLNKM